MGVETGLIITGILAIGLAVGQATGVIETDKPSDQSEVKPAQVSAPASVAVPPAVPAPVAAAPVEAPAPAPAVVAPVEVPAAAVAAAPAPVVEPAPAVATPAPAVVAAPAPVAATPAPAVVAAPAPVAAAPAPAVVAAPAPAAAAPHAAAVPPAPMPSACKPDVNLKGGYVVGMKSEGANCVKSGKIHPLLSIECTDGSPAGWFHRYYLDEKRSPVFVTPCMPPVKK